MGQPAYARLATTRAPPSRAGASIEVVQTMLGHKSATMTLDPACDYTPGIREA
jgi:hypothetical protein